MTLPSNPWILLLTRSLALLLMSVLLPAQLIGCGASTDTGNPPVVDEAKIRIVQADGGVRVSAEAGAVSPGAEVEVENLTTGVSATTTAGADGSFEVTLAGSTEDDYRIVVRSDGRSGSVTIRAGGTVSLEDALLDRSFLLESADGYTPVEGTTIRVGFSDEGFGFSGSCNSHFGEHTLCDGKLCIQGFGSTAMGCESDRMAQDAWLAEFFTSEPRIDLDGDRLTFTGSEATLVFLDRRVASPDRPLTGRLWTVDTLIDGEVASGPFTSPLPTLEFSDDGTLDAFSGCNTLAFDYEADAAEITLSLVSTTDAACTGPAEQHSTHVIDVLTGTVTYEIRERRLTLMNGPIGLGAMTD